jgi:iron complex transport system substrate-binding protein
MHVSCPLAALLLAAALGLAGCGSDSSSDTESKDSSPETRTVSDTMLGDVQDVPVKPKRIVALWRTGGELADLGVTPVGGLEEEFLAEELDPDAYARVKDLPTVGTTEGVDAEKVIALEPDLILGMDNGGLTIDYEELAEVAPTVILKIAEPTDVWNNYPKVAELVGLTSDFEKKDADIKSQLADIEEEFGDKVGGAEATSFGAFDGTIYVDTSKSLGWERIDAAGFGYNPTYTDDPERYSTELSTENIASLADQDILFYDATIDGKPTEGTAQILQLASFKRLPAVRAGNVFPLTSGTVYTFPAAQGQVDHLRAAAEKYQPQP